MTVGFVLISHPIALCPSAVGPSGVWRGRVSHHAPAGIAALRYKPRCVGWRLRPSLRWRRRRQMGRCGSTLISAALPLIQRGNGLRLTWKLAALSGPSNAFEATSEAPSFASCRTIRRSKALVKWEITMCEPSGGSSFLPYSTTPSSTPSASPTEIPFPVSFARVCHRTRPH